MKRMLFNATQPEELRVAIVDGQKLIDLYIETVGKESLKGNIYKAVITRIEPSLEACFVDYGGNRHGFLPFKDVSSQHFQPGTNSRSGIKEALKEGQELLVQVGKDERGNKGAALTTFISLAGRYIVLMPNSPNSGGVSRRIEGEERDELRDLLEQIEVPKGMSIIARTAAIGRTLEEIQWDLSYLRQLWDAIEAAAREEKAPSLIYLESSLVVRAIRDYFSPEIGEILIDTDDVFQQAQAFMSTVMPDNVNRVKRYRDDVPLFSRFQIEHQIQSVHARQVNLPSGGSIVIDHTEALTAIDINSARATRSDDIETTALNTNLEAVDEIARQLRLRDLGGLIVIDFIDMESSKNQRAVEDRLREALRHDRARIHTTKISRFGLLELSRQRLAPSLEEGTTTICPRCNGTGHIRGTESSALNILRIIQEEAMKDNSAAIHAQVPVDVATFLLNEKRNEITRIENRFRVRITLIPNPHLETPHYSVTRLRPDDITPEHLQASYKLVGKPEDPKPTVSSAQEARTQHAQAAVKGIVPTQPAPQPKSGKEESLIARLIGWFKSLGTNGSSKKKAASAKSGRQGRRDRHERDERRARNERDAGKPSHREQPEPDKAAREKRMERQQPHPANMEKPALEAKAPATGQGKDVNSNPEEGRNKHNRRGENHKRGRREQQTAAVPNAETAAAHAAPTGTAMPAQQTRPSEYIAYPDSMKKLQPTEIVCYPAHATPSAPPPVMAPIDLSHSGLTMIETKVGKAAPSQIVENNPRPPRRRPRPQADLSAESEPLQQVETRLSN